MDPIAFLTTIITSEAFSALILTTVAATASAVAGAIIFYVRKRILKDLDSAELQQLREIAALAVRYAEQAFATGDGPAKLAAAMEAADKMLASYGIKVTTTMLRTVIEAAVFTELAEAEPVVTIEVPAAAVAETPPG